MHLFLVDVTRDAFRFDLLQGHKILFQSLGAIYPESIPVFSDIIKIDIFRIYGTGVQGGSQYFKNVMLFSGRSFKVSCQFRMVKLPAPETVPAFLGLIVNKDLFILKGEIA